MGHLYCTSDMAHHVWHICIIERGNGGKIVLTDAEKLFILRQESGGVPAPVAVYFSPADEEVKPKARKRKPKPPDPVPWALTHAERLEYRRILEKRISERSRDALYADFMSWSDQQYVRLAQNKGFAHA